MACGVRTKPASSLKCERHGPDIPEEPGTMRVGIPIIAAIVAFFSLCLLFSGAPDNAGLLASLDPVEAISGLSFAVSFAAGVPATAAVVAAIAVFVSVPAAVALITHRIVRRERRDG